MREVWVSVAQAAMLAETSPATVRKWIQRRHLRRRHGGLISTRDLSAWLDRRNESMAALRRGREE